ncbi:hypothetical protein CsSME_00028290 [Camellia sinensis var. sinensis]
MAIGIDDRSNALLSNGGDKRHNNEIRDLGHRRPGRVPQLDPNVLQSWIFYALSVIQLSTTEIINR